jgi:uncharacterized phage protein gp47/JayE
MAVVLRTYSEILGELVRKMVADTPVNDINNGSVLLTLLEAIATQDFQNSVDILSVLETLSIDALKDQDLDSRGQDYSLTRFTAKQSTGTVTIKNGNITKQSTSLYAVKPPPIAGSTIIYVNDASSWSATGSIYLGRGTQQFEGPISYTSIVNNGSFYTINLSSALQKDHLISDTVVNSQGQPDILIQNSTKVRIPANNQNPEVIFSLLREVFLPSGEEEVSGVQIFSEAAGSVNNAGIGTITEFVTLPFSGALVVNNAPLTDGRDVESDEDFRERIKSYAATLARGTRESILSSIIGVSDQDDGKQIESAVINEPPEFGQPSIIYVDDGTGLQPSYDGQGVDVLLSSATGGEEFLQLSNFPLPRPQVINKAEGPYELVNGMELKVQIDETEESIQFLTSDFSNINAATLIEISVAINERATNFRCRLTESSSRLLLYPVSHEAEFIQVLPLRDGEDATLYSNSILKFPSNKNRYISLYLNSELLSEKESSASVNTANFSSWSISTSGNLIVQVDGTPLQDRSFSSLDFDNAALSSVSLSQWAEVFNKKFAGVTTEESSSGFLSLKSNKVGSDSTIKILGGSYFSQMFSGQVTESIGKNSDFKLNRQTGNLQLKRELSAGDTVSAGIIDAKGAYVSEPTSVGSYNFSLDTDGRPSEMVLCVDGAGEVRSVNPAAGNTIAISIPSTDVMRITGSTLTMFSSAQLNDYLYIAERSAGWVPVGNSGIFKIINKGSHLTAGSDSYVDVVNVGVVAGGPYSVAASEDVVVFNSSTYPQIFKASSLPNPTIATLTDIVNSVTTNLSNVKGSIYRTNKVKVTSSTESDDVGNIFLPVSSGRIANIFETKQELQGSKQTHVATKRTDKDLSSLFRMSSLNESNVFLDRVTYSDLNSTLTLSATPNPINYSELLLSTGVLNSSVISYEDGIFIETGANKGQFRYVKEFVGSDEAGTQVMTPTTIFDYKAGDRFGIFNPLSISNEDSCVFVIDGDTTNKNINLNFWRTGRINSQYIPSGTAFSAWDQDNEPGISFGSLQFWSKTTNETEFSDYAVWFKARNWYRTGGAASGNATMLIRAKEYGPNGDSIRFSLEYPTLPSQAHKIIHTTTAANSHAKYFFQSDANRVVGVTGGHTFKVTNIGANLFRYTFDNIATNFATVLVGDILSITESSGVTAGNRGQFYINNVNIPSRYLDIYNPSGVITSLGQPEITDVTVLPDIIGTPAIHNVNCSAQGNTITTISSGEYFTLYDDAGMVVFWYDVDNVGTATPTVIGASRYVEISTVATGDTSTVVATKTALVVGSDPKFTATSLSNVVTVTNTFNGPVTVGAGGPDSGMSVTLNTAGTSDISIAGKYFIIHDLSGSVAVWYNSGITPEPLHGATRSIQVPFTLGDSATTIANKTSLAVNSDSSFNASFSLGVATITTSFNGSVNDATAGTSGFSIAITQQGSFDGVETLANSQSLYIFPLISNDCQTITNNINAGSSIVEAVPVGIASLTFPKSTKEDTYSYSGNSSALAYGHNPAPLSNLHNFIALYDSTSTVKTFANTNPHFVLKKGLILPGVVPSIYAMDTCPNPNTTDLGEIFKMMPRTNKNILHHLKHKALSQLPIVCDVDSSDNFRKIQIKSKKFGSDGLVEVVGGRANLAEFSILSEPQINSGLLEAKVFAYPPTITKGDWVEVYNTKASKRASRLTTDDYMAVVNSSGINFDFEYKEKEIYSSQFTQWAISDVSASYSRSAGMVYRYQHTDAGSYFDISADANGSTLSAPNEYPATGATPGTAALEVINYVNGSVSTPITFGLTVSSVPAQGDYFSFQTSLGTTFALWFSVDGNITAPTGTVYTAATHKIMCSILSTDSVNDIVDKISVTLQSNANFNANFTGLQIPGTDVSSAVVGDLLVVSGSNAWNAKNKTWNNGEDDIGGFPIIGVGANYLDVINYNGQVQSNAPLGSASFKVFPSPFIRFRPAHSAPASILLTTVTGGVNVSAICSEDHGLGEGDLCVISDANAGLNGTFTVLTVPDSRSFTVTLGAPIANSTYSGGFVTKNGIVQTKYKIESLGVNNLFRLSYASGDAPRFIECGVAVDDWMVLSGKTFSAQNAGKYRVLALSNTHIIFENSSSVEDLHTYKNFNDSLNVVSWVSGSNIVTASSPDYFENVVLGDWVRKPEDDINLALQVIAISGTQITLGQNYRGETSTSTGIALSEGGSFAGALLKSRDDIKFFDGDSAFPGDELVVENISSSTWFNTSNSGVRPIAQIGVNSSTLRPFLRVQNNGGVAESNIPLTKPDGFYITESSSSLYKSYRQVVRTAISQFNSNERSLFLTPATKYSKLSVSYGTKVKSMGKIGFDVSVVSGNDGYSYYTGILRSVQRIVDGLDSDTLNFPGKRAVGGQIEVMPPLAKNIKIALKITVRDGVNLSDISNDIKSTIISYTSELGVGEDFILSAIIARCMQISGIAAITFTTPSPTEERIAVSSDQKALILPDNILIS